MSNSATIQETKHMNADFRKPALAGRGFEYGQSASLEAPYLVYYVKVGIEVITAAHLSVLAEKLTTTGHNDACEWLLDRDDLPISGAGDWLPNVMRQLYPGSVRSAGNVVYIDSRVNDRNSVDISLTTFLGRFGWVIVNDDGQTEYQPDRDPYAKCM